MPQSNVTAPEDHRPAKSRRIGLSLKIISLIFVITIIATVVNSYMNFHEFYWKLFPLPLLFAAILSGFIYFILKPLKSLEQAAKVFGEGQLLHRLNIHTGDEIEEISLELNKMAESVDSMLRNNTTDKNVLSFEHNKLTTIISSILDGIIVLDMHRQVVLNNQEAQRITGYTKAEMKNVPIETLITVTDQEGAPLQTKDLFPVDLGNPAGVAPFINKGALFLIGKDHKKTMITLTSSPINTSTHSDLGCILTLHDLTHERQMESIQLDFVSMASHELRTPLTSIIGYLSIFMDENKAALTDQQKSFLDRVMISAKQLGSLIDNLLNVSKVERGALPVANQEIDWTTFLTQLVDQNKVVAAQKNINLTLKLDSTNLPKIKGDPIRITEVVNNLISNAINYTPNGGSIVVSAKDIGTEIVTSVADTGVGIPSEALPHLFTKFFRVSGALDAASNSKGTGLGLYLCKSIVELHHGRIWATSTLDKGSTFYFTLPISTPSSVTTNLATVTNTFQPASPPPPLIPS